MDYQLKIQQLVTYARCRIYRNFLKSLAEDTTIRTNGSSYLFYFLMLYSLAAFRKTVVRIDGIAHAVSPGEWLISIQELTKLLRAKSHKNTISILQYLQDKHYLTYSLSCCRRYIKFRITSYDNHKLNANVPEADVPCKQDDGFFFFPYKMVSAFIGHDKCSEMDIILDLWLHAIYNDNRIAGSDVGPVVYFRNGSHSPLVGYDELGKRWCVSKSTAGRILRKLEEHGYLKLVSFPGKYGTAIYLNNYLSTMFNISDVSIDKEEVAMSLGIRVRVSDKPVPAVQNGENVPTAACQNSVSEDRISVPETDSCVPKTDLVRIIQKAARVLSLQGIACASCTHARYSLSPLSDDCKKNSKTTELLIRCPGGGGSYRFALQIAPYPDILEKTGKEVG